MADLGLYVQDTWTIKRLTVNAGLRFDYLNNKVEAQDTPGGHVDRPAALRRADRRAELARTSSPRLGVAYDLFGNGKTALKATMSRYVETTTVGFARLLNPINTTVNTATRTWSDANGDKHSAGLRARAARQQRLRPA